MRARRGWTQLDRSKTIRRRPTSGFFSMWWSSRCGPTNANPAWGGENREGAQRWERKRVRWNGSRGCARRLIRPRQARHEHSGARYQSRQASAGLKRRLGSTSRPGDRATRRATFRLIFKSTASTGPALRIYFNAPTRAATGNGSRAQHGRNRAPLIER